MRQRPFRQCALCRREALLCDSHLIPASIMRLLRARDRRNADPLFVSETEFYTTSRPFIDYLLCEECEARFKDRGEDWVAANCCRGRRFKLREALYAHQPQLSHESINLYSAAAIPEIDVERLAYFGTSVIWRAAVHNWRHGKQTVNITLGPYLEPIRLFLAGKRPFPDHVVMILRVSSLDPCLTRMAAPQSEKAPECWLHAFTLMGLSFLFKIGSGVDAKHPICTYPSPHHFIGFAPEADEREVLALIRKHENAKRRGLKPNPLR